MKHSIPRPFCLDCGKDAEDLWLNIKSGILICLLCKIKYDALAHRTRRDKIDKALCCAVLLGYGVVFSYVMLHVS